MISMPIELMEILHNLKDHDYDVEPHYRVDKNEASKVIIGIEKVKTHFDYLNLKEKEAKGE